MTYLVFRFIRVSRRKGSGSIAYISSDVKRYTGVQVEAGSFDEALEKASIVCPKIPKNKLRVVIA